MGGGRARGRVTALLTRTAPATGFCPRRRGRARLGQAARPLSRTEPPLHGAGSGAAWPGGTSAFADRAAATRGGFGLGVGQAARPLSRTEPLLHGAVVRKKVGSPAQQAVALSSPPATR